MTAIRNNLYYVMIVVPVQTVLALGLALTVNNRMLKGKTFFRTAFYFPSVTSSVAISVVFLFMFSSTGAVNKLLAMFGITGPQWFADSRGVLHLLLGAVGVDSPPAGLADGGPFGLTWWDWLSGPSVAMCAIMALVVWTTSGTFMLMFLAALIVPLLADAAGVFIMKRFFESIPLSVEEAARIDGAGRWRPSRWPFIFVVFQRYFVRGANEGADKG